MILLIRIIVNFYGIKLNINLAKHSTDTSKCSIINVRYCKTFACLWNQSIYYFSKSTTQSNKKWIAIKRLTYIDCNNKTRIWEMTERVSDSSECDAVSVLPIVIDKTNGNFIVLISQYRPSLDKYCIDMPAGLVDENENPIDTALRELKEETGLTASYINQSPIISNDCGMSNSCHRLVTVNITSADIVNRSTPLESDYIQTYIVKLAELHDTLEKFNKEGYVIDAKLWYFAKGLSMTM